MNFPWGSDRIVPNRAIQMGFTPGDRVFLFGFSRGAYTVRAVASLVPVGNQTRTYR